MKIIDLLNKIENGEEAPKKIKYNGKSYDYVDYDYFASDYGYLFDRFNVLAILNEEVEILEEKKIPENLFHCCMITDNEETKFLIQNMNDFVDAYNQLIDYLKSKGE